VHKAIAISVASKAIHTKALQALSLFAANGSSCYIKLLITLLSLPGEPKQPYIPYSLKNFILIIFNCSQLKL
jgi:hypothetical protein